MYVRPVEHDSRTVDDLKWVSVRADTATHGARPCRTPPVTILALSLAFFSISASAEVPQAADGTTPREAVDTGRTHSLDELDTGRTESLDSVDMGRTEALDSVDTGHTHSLDSADTGRTESADSLSTGATESLDSVEATQGEWRPPSCDSIDVTLGTLPGDSDPNAWSDVLLEAQQDLEASKYELERADAAYTRARNSDFAVGDVRASVIKAREDARTNYARSRCAGPASLPAYCAASRNHRPIQSKTAE